MFKIKIYKKAKDTLDTLHNTGNSDLKNIITGLDELSSLGIKGPNIKNIGEDIFRKRVGRWRILFTFDNLFHIWIIDLEKDTKKDYKKWKNFILSKIK